MGVGVGGASRMLDACHLISGLCCKEIIIEKEDGCGRRLFFLVGSDPDEFGCNKRRLRCKRASFSLCRLIREEAR